MTTNSRIEWTERTWNPTIGCSKITPGCINCYAEKMSLRLQAMRVKGYENGFKLKLLPERLQDPLKRKKPTIFFVNSMSDLFHEEIPYEYIRQVFSVIKATPQHTYQILTKRADRMVDFFNIYGIAPHNAWLGVTVENREHGIPRIDCLRMVPASLRFISVEPLLESLVNINLLGIDWVIVGGESGQNARQMQHDWVVEIKQQCQSQKVLFFFKQWGAWGEDGKKRAKRLNGCELDGEIWKQSPFNILDNR